jgi:hypothetical protein
LLSRTRTHAIEALTEVLAGLSGSQLLCKVLLSKGSLLLRSAKTLRIQLLTKALLSLTKAETLLEGLLAQSGLLLSLRGALTKEGLSDRGLLLGGCCALTEQLLSEGGLSLSGAEALRERLLTEACDALTGSNLLAKQLLSQRSLLLSGTDVLTKPGLADTKQLRCSGLLSGTVGLLGAESKSLLLLGGGKSLTVARLHDVRERLALGQRLLLLEVRRGNGCTIATEGAGADRIA